jgi:hypothetical protein
MEDHVRSLLCWYGIKPVRECIDKVCKELYDELKSVYDQPAVEVVSETVADSVVEPVQEKKEKRLRIVKKKEVQETVPEPVQETVADSTVNIEEKPNDKVVEVVTMKIKKKVAPPVEVKQTVNEESNESESDSDATVPVDMEEKTYKVKTSDEVKKERLDHRAAVEKKRKELIEQGIVPESLVTKENLEKWLGAGLSYQRIAKELTGCPDAYISTIAKSFGLRSLVAGIIAGKYKSMK